MVLRYFDTYFKNLTAKERKKIFQVNNEKKRNKKNLKVSHKFDPIDIDNSFLANGWTTCLNFLNL